MAYAAARVIDIALEPGNKMDVQMEHRLARRGSDIEANVVAVGPVTLIDNHFCRIYQRQ